MHLQYVCCLTLAVHSHVSAFTRQLTETSASLVLLWESSSMGSMQDGAAISYDYAQQERKELWWRWAAKHLIC